MIKSIRNKHFVIWLILLILLPVLIALTYGIMAHLNAIHH